MATVATTTGTRNILDITLLFQSFPRDQEIADVIACSPYMYKDEIYSA